MMDDRLSRRDVLRLAGGLSGAAAVSRFLGGAQRSAAGAARHNVIILVFDALSAANMSVFGYPRQTTPNFESFAERAVVFHSHRANGNFTTPGVASLLTGMIPWTHRALNSAGLIERNLAERSIFHVLGAGYRRLAYTQNYWADYLLNQFSADLDDHVPLSAFGEVDDVIVDERFTGDALVAYRAYESLFFQGSFQNPNSLLFGFWLNWYYQRRVRRSTPPEYPLGLPTSNHLHHVYTVESSIDGVLAQIARLEAGEAPYLAYFHVWPPHSPYRPRVDFLNRFADDEFRPVNKRQHPLSSDSSQQKLDDYRRQYDAFLAHVDSEFGRALETLKQAGVLDRAFLFVTSDHGEMFERGTFGHFTPLMYEPVVRVPLLVSVPGSDRRVDIRTPTSSVDLLPTLAKLALRPYPEWAEGQPLPGLGGVEDDTRLLFTVEAKRNASRQPLRTATFAVVQGTQKLIHYVGYEGKFEDHSELYDLENDPEEMNDLSARAKGGQQFKFMLDALLERIHLADAKYR